MPSSGRGSGMGGVQGSATADCAPGNGANLERELVGMLLARGWGGVGQRVAGGCTLGPWPAGRDLGLLRWHRHAIPRCLCRRLGSVPMCAPRPARNPTVSSPPQMTVDRATIERHFLTSQTDPFSRTPLTLDAVRPNGELQQRAQEWLRSRGRA